jgi:nucleotide-binding universal stress UspA family protein
MTGVLRALSLVPLRALPLPAPAAGFVRPPEAGVPARPAPGRDEPLPAPDFRDDVRPGRRVYGRVVVGYDGSAGARLAAELAVEEARRRAATLTVVRVWHGDPIAAPPGAGGQFADDMRRAAEEELAGAVSALEIEGVRLELLTLEGNAPRRLEEVAREADLLVVGSRGHGALASTLLGSVSLHCVLHAPCPVLVVPPTRRRF